MRIPKFIVAALMAATATGAFAQEADTAQMTADQLWQKAMEYYQQRNRGEFINYTQKAAEAGNPEAQLNLAAFYRYGIIGDEPNDALAEQWIAKVAANPNPEAMYQLAQAYQNGDAVEADAVKAAQLYKQASDKGNEAATVAYGYCLIDGNGTEADPQAAAQRVQDLAAKGNADAQNIMGYAAMNAPTPDYAKAQEWLTLAVEQGNDKAKANLGLLYLMPNNPNANVLKAVEWLADQHSDANATNVLGQLYRDGAKDLAADPEKAAKYFAYAAMMGDNQGKINYAQCLIDGIGVSKDVYAGQYWLQQAQNTAAANPCPKPVKAIDTKGVVTITDNDINKYLEGDRLVIVDFNATWCGPCRELTPVFDKAAEKYAGKAIFLSVDVDKNPEIAQKYGIRSIPYVMFVQPQGNFNCYLGTDELLPQTTFDALVDKYLGK